MTKTLTPKKQRLLQAIDAELQVPEPGQLRAVAYLRVSTEDQRKGYGISYTGKRVVKHIATKGWALVDVFADEGVSGTLDHTKRPDLRELMALARQTPRPFDVVVVQEERAIGRRDKAFWPWVWKLEDDYGIFTAVVKGNYDNTTDEGRSRMRKAQDRAEDELITLRDRTQGGVQEKAEAGGHVGGVAPYGYRIENKGILGESRLVLDKDGENCAYDILHRAYRRIVHDGKTPGEVEAEFNAEGIPGPVRPYWPRGSLRHILTGQAVQKAVRVFRDPKGPKTRLDNNGLPIFGQTITIKLDPIFTEEQLARLNRALARGARGPRTSEDAVHPLTGHLISKCGKHRIGASGTGRAKARVYRCTGNKPKPGEKKCGCRQVDAQALENRVWSAICQLLEDPDRLHQMAQDWVDMMMAGGMDYEARIKELDELIEEQEETIDATTLAVIRRSQRKGLGPEATQEAVERATRELEENLAGLEKLRDEARQWQEESKRTEERARDLRRLADVARVRLHSMDAREQEEIMDLLDLRVTILGDARRKTRSDDQISNWFRERERVVPTLTDEAWALCQPILASRPGRKPTDPRALLDALLMKARTGCAWSEVPYGNVASIWKRWHHSGLWEELMEALAGVPGEPPHDAIAVPPLRIEGRVDPRLIISEDDAPSEDDPFKSSAPGAISFRLELAA
jgi:DNA invertase Pin-like site-specific DNA recombinase